MRGKRIRDKLRAGRPVFTAVLKFHAPRLVEMLARSGADQIFLDAEHGPLSEAECEEMVRAADLYDVPVAIRVPVNTPHVILRYLDIGTSAIMVPHVTSRADAERAVRAVKYPPGGTRSFALGRVAELLHLGPDEYVRRANDETVVYALFEDVAGVDDRGDLPGPGHRRHGCRRLRPRRVDGPPGRAVARRRPGGRGARLQTCRHSRTPLGTVPRDRADLGRQIERGCQLITVATIEWGIQATRDTVAEFVDSRAEARDVTRASVKGGTRSDVHSSVPCPNGSPRTLRRSPFPAHGDGLHVVFEDALERLLALPLRRARGLHSIKGENPWK